MTDILSRKELEEAKAFLHNPKRIVNGLGDDFNERILDTALWLAEKGRLAALDSVGPCGECPSIFECGLTQVPCQTAARELLDWWGEE